MIGEYRMNILNTINFYVNNNENDLVLDLTCSDGQSAIACRNLKRRYIGVDISPTMISDAEKNFEQN